MQKRSQSETGHAKNVANFEDLIAGCNSFGMAYNPSRMELHLGNLQQLLMEARMTLDQLIDRVTANNNAINQRSMVFKNSKPFVTRIANALAANGASAKTMEDVRSIQRKINGARSSKKPIENGTATPIEEVSETTFEQGQNATLTAPRQISASQQSYDLLVEHFTRLVSLVQSEVTYMPNEPELQMSALQMLLQNLRQSNTLVTNTTTEVMRARFQRDKCLYHEETGLCRRAQQVKMYVKSVFGASSPEYQQINRINFRSA